LLGLLATTGLSGACCAQDAAQQREAQLKAAYVFNFIKFVDWDARPTGKELDVCFTGADAVRDALSLAVSDKNVGNRKVSVRSAVPNSGKEDCDVIYVAAAHTAMMPSTRVALTVSDAPSFTRDGGMIRLYTEENRLRFVVNVGNARKAGIAISSNLLRLASQVEQ
jgi:hypothetical protein